MFATPLVLAVVPDHRIEPRVSALATPLAVLPEPARIGCRWSWNSSERRLVQSWAPRAPKTGQSFTSP